LRGETPISLKLNDYFQGVSPFHDFCSIAAINFNRLFRFCPAQLELPRRPPEKPETAKRRAISPITSDAYPFQPALKQRETVCDTQSTARAQPITLGAQRGR
jgi:hypothetical protein